MTISPRPSKRIAIIGADATNAATFRSMIENAHYRTAVYSSLSELKDSLAEDPFMAVILDADSISLDNFTIRKLKASNPAVHFLLTSREHFHPELQESISHILYACLKIPPDFEEISYLLKSIRDVAPDDDRNTTDDSADPL